MKFSGKLGLRKYNFVQFDNFSFDLHAIPSFYIFIVSVFCGLKVYASGAKAEKQIKNIAIKLLLTFFFYWSPVLFYSIYHLSNPHEDNVTNGTTNP